MMVGLPPNWQTGGFSGGVLGGAIVDRGAIAVGPAVADKCNVVKWLKEHGGRVSDFVEMADIQDTLQKTVTSGW